MGQVLVQQKTFCAPGMLVGRERKCAKLLCVLCGSVLREEERQDGSARLSREEGSRSSEDAESTAGERTRVV